MKKLLALILFAGLAYGQTIDTVLTTDTPNAGRIKWNNNDIRIRSAFIDSVATHRKNIDSALARYLRLSDSLFLAIMKTDTTSYVATRAWVIAQGYGTGTAIWGGLTGTLSSQTDLWAVLQSKIDTLDLLLFDTTGVGTADSALVMLAPHQGKIEVVTRKDGSQYIYGAGPPSAGLGNNNDFYWDTTNLYEYHKMGGIWRQRP